MSRIKELQSLLMKELAGRLEKLGFDKKPVGQTFYLKRSFGWAAFHLAFIPHEQVDFDITGDVAVRIDAVEALVNEDNNLTSKKEKLRTATMGCGLGNLSQGRQRRWTVAAECDLTPTAESLQNAAESIALPYIAGFSDLEEVLRVLSDNGPAGWLHSPIHGARCQRALALAFVLGKRDALEAITAESEHFLKSRNDLSLTQFRLFAEKIRALSKGM